MVAEADHKKELDLQTQRTLERRSKITDAARKLFIENGFHNTGMAQLSKESGVLVGQIYRDYCSKEEIVSAIVEWDLQESLAVEDLRASIAIEDRDAVKEWIRQYVRGPEDDSGVLFAEIVAESSRNPKIAGITREAMEQMRTAIVDALTLLSPDPAKAETRERLARAILSISGGMLMQQSIPLGQYDKKLSDHIVAMIDREVSALEQ
ncbi:MAG: TetR family transcriptional regulator [Sphingopyxis sp.]|nr:MAG: TetR family transcriptional regulator [Sphingopyxis sp.]